MIYICWWCNVKTRKPIVLKEFVRRMNGSLFLLFVVSQQLVVPAATSVTDTPYSLLLAVPIRLCCCCVIASYFSYRRYLIQSGIRIIMICVPYNIPFTYYIWSTFSISICVAIRKKSLCYAAAAACCVLLCFSLGAFGYVSIRNNTYYNEPWNGGFIFSCGDINHHHQWEETRKKKTKFKSRLPTNEPKRKSLSV